MRRIRSITIEGFKTFARRSTVELADGLTVVVGPNGTGKSNLVDAVAWAVGSRSWKSLRGDSMEDVIFHGGEGTPQAKKADVKIVLDNQDRLFGLDFEEIEVGRELVRGGGGRATINRVDARLKDIQILLSSTGLVGGFSLVRQGMVDRMVLASPREMGKWIEEAAGTAGTRIRKQEAIDRLFRVEAHHTEAKRTLDSLRREARRIESRAEEAARKKALEERATGLSAKVAAVEAARIDRALEEVSATDGSLIQEEERLLSRRDGLKSQKAEIEERLSALLGSREPGKPPVDKDAGLSGDEAACKAREILSIGESLVEEGTHLKEEGATRWPVSRGVLEKAQGSLYEIETARAGTGSPSEPEIESKELVPLLRRRLAEIEELDQVRSGIAEERSLLAQEKARLLERRRGLPERPEVTNEDLGMDLEGCRAEIETLHRGIDAIGPVDETAIGRQEELRAEIETSTRSLEDIERTEGELKAFIAELDACTSGLFEETLRAVGERFQAYFETLFQGGTVRLCRVEPSAEEEDGEPEKTWDENEPPPIEIRVKLPRKQETALSLLSGGERSLAGLSLTLALAAGSRSEQGAGILILDEVDAALDEENVTRFSRLLSELAGRFQILCVTHNRLTMGVADRLIGVTSGRPASTSILVVETSVRRDPSVGMGTGRDEASRLDQDHDLPSEPIHSLRESG